MKIFILLIKNKKRFRKYKNFLLHFYFNIKIIMQFEKIAKLKDLSNLLFFIFYKSYYFVYILFSKID
ncbi:hypothetical protein MCSF7_01171 [Mycoplasmopsis columbina SF7]|uniref:Uncharacterized protein n=1 Tax=Mycoplasmopsis columbina SF7 TaxID=1037410 RepID=F9UK23_9BACT|nr:hypothetical protein MCSF7_01171 [Mycoplasmopsis columbina SF7]